MAQLISGKVRRFRFVFGFALRYLQPLRWRIAAATMLSLAASGFLTLTTLALAPVLHIIVLGPPNPNTAPPGANPSLFDLNTSAQIILGQLNTLLPLAQSPVALGVLLGGAVVLLALLTLGLNLAGQVLWTDVRIRYARQIQSHLYQHLCRLPLTFFAQSKAGNLVSVLNYDVDDLGGIVQMFLHTPLRSLVVFVFFLVILLRTSVPLTAVSGVAALLYLLGADRIGRLVKHRTHSRLQAKADLLTQAEETFHAIRAVKAFGREGYQAGKFRAGLQDLSRAEKYETFLNAHLPAALTPALTVTLGLVVAVAGMQQVVTGQITPPGLLMFIASAGVMFGSAASIGTVFVNSRAYAAAAERVASLFRQEPGPPDGLEEPGEFEELALTDVSFSYEEEPILQNVSLTLRRGTMLALVGPSGAGKSTLVDLVLRFYDPCAGEITLNGRDVRHLKLASYRNLFGVVSQETLLLNASVEENIAFGRTELSRSDVVAAARLANAHDFIVELPQGYQTIIGDRGARLSGGQRQRIAIARAVAAQPQILVLDEATSALDSESELQVQSAIEQVLTKSTALVIAHRLSTIQKADTIIVIDKGRIVGEGSHADLAAENLLYRRLYDLQINLS